MLLSMLGRRRLAGLIAVAALLCETPRIADVVKRELLYEQRARDVAAHPEWLQGEDPDAYFVVDHKAIADGLDALKSSQPDYDAIAKRLGLTIERSAAPKKAPDYDAIAKRLGITFQEPHENAAAVANEIAQFADILDEVLGKRAFAARYPPGSDQRPSGSEYVVLASVPLGAAAAAWILAALWTPIGAFFTSGVVTRKHLVVWIWIVCLIGAGLYPPRAYRGRSYGWQFLLAPSGWTYADTPVDQSKLTLEWLLISFAAAGFYFAWPEKKSGQ